MFATVLLLLSVQVTDADVTNERWKAFYEKIAQNYSISTTGEDSAQLEISKQPALVWSNPARAGDTRGAFWVWTHDGRPRAVGTIFSYILGSAGHRVVAHEFHSLSKQPLTASLDDRVVWTPKADGVKWVDIPSVPSPAKTRTRRLSQMRAIARKLIVTAQNEVEANTNGQQRMRLLSQPLFRYETDDDEPDGALFTFVLGTDPECLLLIESTADGSKWRLAAAKFTHLTFQVELNGEVILRHERGEPERDRTSPYVCFRNGRAPLEAPPIEE